MIVDEVSMLGCHKLLEIDSILRKVRKVPAPFGGLDVIFVGDFAQLAPVKQLSILDAMVNTTLAYTGPAEYAIKTAALMRLFRKFELSKFCRSENCPLLCSILTRFRRTDSKKDSVTVKDIKDIGVATHDTFVSDIKFRFFGGYAQGKRCSDFASWEDLGSQTWCSALLVVETAIPYRGFKRR